MNARQLLPLVTMLLVLMSLTAPRSATAQDNFASAPPKGTCDPRICGEFANCLVDGGGGDLSISPHVVEVGKTFTATFTPDGLWDTQPWSWHNFSLHWQNENLCSGPGAMPGIQMVGNCAVGAASCTFRVVSQGSTDEDQSLGGRPWVIMRLRFSVGCCASWDEDYFGVIKQKFGPDAVFTWQADDQNPLLVHFDASDSDDPDGEIVSYDWSFGDDKTGEGLRPDHTYEKEGSYSVRLTVKDNDGEEDKVTKTVNLNAARMEYKVIVAPDSARLGNTVKMKVAVKNTGIESLTEIQVVGEPTTTGEEGGEVKFTGPPDPAQLNLDPQASDTLVYEYEATKEGRVVFAVQGVRGKDEDGERVDGDFACSKNDKCNDRVAILGPEVVVNSVEDRPLKADVEGCDTGKTVDRNGETEPECTLRAAIQTVNKEAGGAGKQGDETLLRFDIPGGSSVVQIAVGKEDGQPLPDLTASITLDGSTQPGTDIQIMGTLVDAGSGLVLSGQGITVRGLSIYGFSSGAGIELSGGGGHVIVGNRIGTDRTSFSGFGNEDGIQIDSDGNQIGSQKTSDRNIISGNIDNGITLLDGSGNVIAGNFIGANTEGQGGLSNRKDGIAVLGGSGNTIGGATEIRGRELGNTIVTNDDNGIRIGDGVTDLRVEGNLIQINGDAGVRFDGGSSNFIGSALADQGNTIEFNEYGVLFEGGRSNRVQGNTFEGNSKAEVLIRNAQFNVVGGPSDTPGEAPGNEIKGVVIIDEGSSFNALQGNTIRNKDQSLEQGHSVIVRGEGTTKNKVGGGSLDKRNVLWGSGSTGAAAKTDCSNAQAGAGVLVQSSGNEVLYNYAGTNEAGTSASPNVVGVLVESPGVRVADNLLSGNACAGLLVRVADPGDPVVVVGNRIGTDADGLAALPNEGHGIMVLGGEVTIGGARGGACEAPCNLISGNHGDGIHFFNDGTYSFGANNKVQGNFIGVDLGGTRSVANEGSGIVTPESAPLMIGGASQAGGGSCDGVCNVIAGNKQDGIRALNMGNIGKGSVKNGDFTGLTVQGNFIGVGINGNPVSVACLTGGGGGNCGNGIALGGVASNNLIGGSEQEGNVIANNGRTGVLMAAGIRSGLVPRPISGQGNVVRSNRIYNNGALGIDLSGNPSPVGDGPSAHGAGGAGPNGMQSAPNLIQAVREGTAAVRLYGSMQPPGDSYTVQVFANRVCDDSILNNNQTTNWGEGEVPIHEVFVNTNNFEITLFGVGSMPYLTATATGSNGTSEFSQCIEIADAGQTTQVVLQPGVSANGNGAIVTPTTGTIAAKTGAAATLFISRYDTAPIGNAFSGSGATAPDGSVLLPVDVAAGYWRLAGVDLSDTFTYDLCLDASGFSPAQAGQMVLVQRHAENGGIWQPHDTRLDTRDGTRYACTDGLTTLGEFGFGLGSITTLATPTLVSPEDGAEDVTIPLTLFWETLPNAATYDVQMAFNTRFTTLVLDTTGVGQPSLTVPDLDRVIEHYWRVRGVTATDEVGPWSPPFRFTTFLTQVGLDDEELPEGFSLAQNYPNPFNPQTTILFTLPQPEWARLAVYDVLGREVAVLVEGPLPAGRHRAVFDAARLPSGVYLYQLRTARQVLSRRMLLVK
ncbi:MAG: PKD domain-containing protein [Rhodothermales bacterium]